MAGVRLLRVAVEGVLFDLDDTLVDHRGAVERGLRVWLGSLGLDGSLEEHMERWFVLETRHYERAQRREISHTEQRRVRIREFLPGWDLADDALADDTFAGFLACYQSAWAAHRDAPAALERALGAGLAVGILTNGEQAIQESKLRRTGLASYDVAVFASSALPAAKPDPRAFHTACGKLGVAPARTLMVGDSLRHDAEGGRAAGLTPALLDRTGRHARRQLHGIRRITSLDALAW